jgi:hypothetical protein
MFKKILLALLFIIGALSAASAQEKTDSTALWRIETMDGNIFTGRIVSESGGTIILSTERLGNITVQTYDIKSRILLDNPVIVDGKVWLPNPQSSRYFWAPNGYGLGKGNNNYQNIWIFYNQASFGLSDNFSIGAGMIPLFLFNAGPTPVWIVPKFSIPIIKDKVNFGTGAFLGSVIGESMGLTGLVFGTTTFGSRDKNMSIGIAYGFNNDDWMDTPIINLSFMGRVNPKTYLISENYILPIEGEVFAIFSFGGRSIVRNISIDYSLWVPGGFESGVFIAIPYLGISVPFGNKK